MPKKKRSNVMGSPAVPMSIFTKEDFQLGLLNKIQEQWEPDSHDIETLLSDYSDYRKRDLIDQVFIALTGWSLASLSAMTEFEVEGDGLLEVLEHWKKNVPP